MALRKGIGLMTRGLPVRAGVPLGKAPNVMYTFTEDKQCGNNQRCQCQMLKGACSLIKGSKGSCDTAVGVEIQQGLWSVLLMKLV